MHAHRAALVENLVQILLCAPGGSSAVSTRKFYASATVQGQEWKFSLDSEASGAYNIIYTMRETEMTEFEAAAFYGDTRYLCELYADLLNETFDDTTPA